MTNPEPPVFRCEEHGVGFHDQRGIGNHLRSKVHGYVDRRGENTPEKRKARKVAVALMATPPPPLVMNISPEEWVRFLGELLAQRQELRGMVERLSRELEAKLAELETLRKKLETADATALYLRSQLEHTVSAALSNEQAEVYQEYAQRLT